VGLDSAHSQRFGGILYDHDSHYKCAGTVASARSMTQKLTAERFLFLQDAGLYSKEDEANKVRLFSTRLMDIWAGGHDEWSSAIEHQKGS
jgi:hypothetical protein